MASGVWVYALAEMARGNIDYLNDTIKAQLVDVTFSPSFTSVQDLADVGEGDRIGDPTTLTDKTISDAGILDCGNITFLNVTASLTAVAIVFYYASGVEGTSTLIAYHDVDDLVTDGNNVVYTVHANGVLDLG